MLPHALKLTDTKTISDTKNRQHSLFIFREPETRYSD
jgi:hypothetical protein